MIRKPIEKPQLKKHLESISRDTNLVFLLSGGKVRGSLVHGTAMVNGMRANHNLGILETLILGHSYIGAGLLTSMVKGNDRIGLTIECGGPVKGISVEASADGGVRGYLMNNPIPVKSPWKVSTCPRSSVRDFFTSRNISNPQNTLSPGR